MIEDYIVQKTETVFGCLRKMEERPRKVMYICDGYKLLGAVTDGDIRRHLIDGGDIYDNVCNAGNMSPICLKSQDDQDIDYRKVLTEYEIDSLPLVDSEHRIIWIASMTDFNYRKHILKLPVVIMAGGKGMRLKPYTSILPKPLIPIGEKTITEQIMSRFETFGCKDFHMIINYKKNFIRAYFEEASLSSNLYFVEEKEFFGTAGGIKYLEEKLNSTFFVTNCDIIVDSDYYEIVKFHAEHKNIITIVCAKVTETLPYGIVSSDANGYVTGVQEKPSRSYLTNTGFYVAEPEIFQYIPNDAFTDMTEVIQTCIKQNVKVGSYAIPKDCWLDMGQLSELEKLKQRME